MTHLRTYAFIVLGFIAGSFGAIAPAAAAGPFDRMIGCWTGTAQMYDPNGGSAGTANSTGSVSWKTPGTQMHFKQVQAGGTLEYDLDVVGQVAKFRSPDVDVTGTALDGRTYEFVLNFKTGPFIGTWYNVHYFTSVGRRRVMGAFQAGTGQDSEAEFLAVQHLKRVVCLRFPAVAQKVLLQQGAAQQGAAVRLIPQ
jgi:hypothetical protein